MTPRNQDPKILDGWRKLPGVYMVMGETAEVVAKRYKISRQEQDEYSLLSQKRTARAQQQGFFPRRNRSHARMACDPGQENQRSDREGRKYAPIKMNAIDPRLRWKDCCTKAGLDTASGQGTLLPETPRSSLTALRRHL